MKIGTCVILDAMEGIPKKLETLRDNGFDSCQLLSWNDYVKLVRLDQRPVVFN